MKKIIVVAMTIALSCLFLSTPASADYNYAGWPVETRVSGTVNGGVFIGYVPWDGEITLTGDFDVPDGDIEWAGLYTGIWGSTPEDTGWVEVTFNGVDDENGLGPILLQGKNDTNQNVLCSGYGKHWMCYDVTNLVDPGSMNTAHTWETENSTLDGRVYGIVLVVVYEGGEDPKDIQYWINDGSDSIYHDTHYSGTTDFDGVVDTDIVVDAKLTMVHLTAELSCNDCVEFNDNALDTRIVDSNTFELNTWTVTDYMEPEGNNVWFSRGDDDYVSVTNAILIVERGTGIDEEPVEKPELLPTAIKPYHYEWIEEENRPKGDPWFNLTNYVNVTMKNSGSVEAESFKVKLYADETLIGSEIVDGLSAGDSTDMKFEWKPEGGDPLSWTDTSEGAKLTYTDASKTYTLRAVVDDEENNELTKKQKVVWNGYVADEPLENYAHELVNGGIIYTTGDGQYRGIGSGTKYGAYYDINYDLPIPGDTKFARLYIYYTWAQPSYKAPKIGVTLKTPSDNAHDLKMEKSYNDIKGDFGAFKYVWGTYAYNITGYVNESGTYVVSITNLNDGGDLDFATEYAIAAPAILVIYENITMPKREYWINEGADVLMGGRRSDGGFLALEECKNTALFQGSIDLSEVEKATLGFVSPWGDFSEDDVLYFNDKELGKGVYCGYNSPCSEEIDGISMNIGASSAQVGIGAIDVTSYLKGDKNTVVQGDEGDNMMPCNAFLVISYPSTPTAAQTPTPAATPASTVNVTPTPTPAITPTSTPTPTEEKQKTGADEAPVPGFELAISLSMLIIVAYIIRVRKQGRY
ncbi:MAG: DUF3344 domain-containing protein [Methanophagales archaeon]|nr:DUF3344 domain-containing protein [Methanophagales archaeon]